MTAPAKQKVHPAWEIVYAMQRDHQALGARIAALRQWLASQDLPDPLETSCPKCGVHRSGPIGVAEHLYSAHDGPVPAHWMDEA